MCCVVCDVLCVMCDMRCVLCALCEVLVKCNECPPGGASPGELRDTDTPPTGDFQPGVCMCVGGGVCVIVCMNVCVYVAAVIHMCLSS